MPIYYVWEYFLYENISQTILKLNIVRHLNTEIFCSYLFVIIIRFTCINDDYSTHEAKSLFISYIYIYIYILLRKLIFSKIRLISSLNYLYV